MALTYVVKRCADAKEDVASTQLLPHLLCSVEENSEGVQTLRFKRERRLISFTQNLFTSTGTTIRIFVTQTENEFDLRNKTARVPPSVPMSKRV